MNYANLTFDDCYNEHVNIGSDSMFLGERLKQLRLEKGLSQQELGDLIGVSKVSISEYENGNRIPLLNNFNELLDVFHVKADYFLGRDIIAVSEEEEPYTYSIAKEDIAILKALKKEKSLYLKLYRDPVRTVELIQRKLNK